MTDKLTRRPIGAEYRFRIDAYSPDTIPMARLAEYMAQLAGLLGERTAVHFQKLSKGSTVLNTKVDHEAIPKVRHRVLAVRSGDATGDGLQAYAALNKLLRDDNAIGQLRDPACRGVVLTFPGVKQIEERFPPVRQNGSIDGILTGIRGRDQTIHITVETGGLPVTGCETTRLIAKQLAGYLYEPVRLFGKGQWVRDSDGEWSLSRFKIDSFEVLQDVSLTTALDALRAIPTNWGDGAYTEITKMREGPGGNKHGGH